jgi:uncharacterized membrane protein
VSDRDFATGSAARRWRAISIALMLLLILLLFLWQLVPTFAWSRAGLALLLSLPLWAPLPGLIRANRRTYAWATLCVIPYFIVGITESIANPVMRGWSAACLALSLFLFVSLIAYLRVTRPTSS